MLVARNSPVAQGRCLSRRREQPPTIGRQLPFKIKRRALQQVSVAGQNRWRILQIQNRHGGLGGASEDLLRECTEDRQMARKRTSTKNCSYNPFEYAVRRRMHDAIKSMAESDKRRNSVQSVAAEINFVPGGVFRSVPRTNVEKNSVVSGNACDIRETSPTSRIRGEECPGIRAFTFTHPASTSKHKNERADVIDVGTEGTGTLANHIGTPAC